jgi:hypothetical protein
MKSLVKGYGREKKVWDTLVEKIGSQTAVRFEP